MQSALSLDQDADLDTLPPAYQPKIKFQKRPGHEHPVAYFPKGTVFDGDHAVALVKTGQAIPIDDECAKACGLDLTQLTRRQREYLAASRGIKGKKDHAMFMAGAIEGYADGTTDDHPVYLPGPNWQAWQDAEAEADEAVKKDVI